jgi:hypothetical protein
MDKMRAANHTLRCEVVLLTRVQKGVAQWLLAGTGRGADDDLAKPLRRPRDPLKQISI